MSADREQWLLLNASPDLRQQILANPALHPKCGMRHSPIKAVFLTSGDIDHIAGLLTLRERQPFSVYGTRKTLAVLEANVFAVLAHDCVQRIETHLDESLNILPNLRVTPFAVPGKTPLYLENDDVAIGLETEETIGLKIEADSRKMVYIPSCAKVTDGVRSQIAGADLLLFDGTTWTNDEMPMLGVSEKTAHRMGHLSMSESDGSIAALASVPVPQRIFVHINNTNPVLREDSVERAQARDAGWDIAYDGMEFSL